jgi:NADH-quinone oxidoreductase subunit C
MTDETVTAVEMPEVVVRALPDADWLRGLIEPFAEAVWEISRGQDVVHLPPEQLLEFARAAKAAGFECLADVTAVDWYRRRRPRFELVVNLLSMARRHRLRLLVPLEGDEPVVASLCPVWPGANFPEREVYDMFGIQFDGHPDLSRILMPDDWEGFPLRKDFGTGSVPVQFKDAHKVQ